MPQILSRYSVEIYDTLGNIMADLSGKASMRELHVARNRGGSCAFQLDLSDLEQYARAMNTPASDILFLNRNEVKIRRGTSYLFGGQLNHLETVLSESRTMDVKAVGYFELLGDRFFDVETVYTGVDAGAMAWNMINTTQGQTNGNFGMTQGTIQASQSRDRTYPIYKNIKDAIIELSEVVNGFDFEMDYNKVFRVYYPLMGLNKPELRFSYPGNIKSIRLPRDGTKMFNRAIVRGQGFGDAQPIVEVDDVSYQALFKVRETVIDHPSVIETNTLTQHGQEQVNIFKKYFEIPQVSIDGNVEPYIGSYWLGDRISLTIEGTDMYKHIQNMLYRIDAIDIRIDENDVEEITLSLSLTS